MKALPCILILAFVPLLLPARDTLRHMDRPYGPHERQVFDLVVPPSDSPVPLVIYYHGGGFSHGDKKEGWKKEKEARAFLDQGIAFATANYRFYESKDSLGVQNCLDDVTRTLQHLRHHAEEFGIDPERIAVYGTSAGAGSSLYLAFKDDMAVPGDTGIAGESTRICCAGALATQASYDIFRWKRFIPGLRLMFLLKRKSFNHSLANFYGYPDYKSFKAEKKTITQGLDMLDMISPDDPPVYVWNWEKKRFPGSVGVIYHHRRQALVLEKFMDRMGVKHQVFVHRRRQTRATGAPVSVSEFMIPHLLASPHEAKE